LTKLRLNYASACDYDRTRALVDGAVRPVGIDLNFMVSPISIGTRSSTSSAPAVGCALLRNGLVVSDHGFSAYEVGQLAQEFLDQPRQLLKLFK
jgi:hypothetical protein